MDWTLAADTAKAHSQRHSRLFPIRPRIRVRHRNNPSSRRRRLTFKRSKHSWQICVLPSMESRPMDSINKSRALIPSSSQLGMILSKHGYIAKTEIVNVLFLALQLQKPLLLEGPPGAGKTQVAKVLSEALELPLIRLQCYEGIDEARALYQWNEPLQRIALELLRDTKRITWHELKGKLYRTDFLVPGRILRALESYAKAVLLIDEIDKTSAAFEAFLLEI